MKNIGIYIFDHIEVLDFAGPFEVFSTASRVAQRAEPGSEAPFNVVTIAESDKTVSARGHLLIKPSYTINDHPELDVLIVPGGDVTAELSKPQIISWIEQQAQHSEMVASVCTGAFLLGKAGLLAGKRATTHWEDIADLQQQFPDTDVIPDARWVDEDPIITSAGISAGLDMSLHLVACFTSQDLAVKTARQMEYVWQDGNPLGL